MKPCYKCLTCVFICFTFFIFQIFISNQISAAANSAEQFAQQLVDQALDSQMKAYAEVEADQIISRIITPKMTEDEKEKAIHNYIIKNTKYDVENYRNNTIPRESYSPYGVLVLGCGVCQGYAEATQMLCTKAGLQCLVIHGEAYSEGNWGGHAWNLIKINGVWYHLDTTWDDPYPDRGREVQYNYFNLTDQEIGTNHRWDKSKYPAATTHYKNVFTMDLIDKIMLKINSDANLNDPEAAKQYYSAGIVVVLILLVLIIRK